MPNSPTYLNECARLATALLSGKIECMSARISKLEIRRFHERCCRPQSWRDLNVIVEEMRESAGFGCLVQPGLSAAWRDAFVACEVARIKSADQVYLIENDPPDFAIVVSGQELMYETVSVNHADRKIGQEYKHYDNIDNAIPEIDIIVDDKEISTEICLAIKQLRSAIFNKSKKSYGREVGLLVYLNFSSYPWVSQKLTPRLFESIRGYEKEFTGVAVLYGGRLYSTK